MLIKIRFFAILRDRAETAGLDLDLPEGSTVSAALAEVSARSPAVASFLPSVATAVNRAYVPRDCVLRDNDELALIPPVSGG